MGIEETLLALRESSAGGNFAVFFVALALFVIIFKLKFSVVGLFPVKNMYWF